MFTRLLIDSDDGLVLCCDLPLTPGEHVFRGDVANRAVQADVVVMLDVALHHTPRIVQRQWRTRPDALSFERFVPSFDLATTSLGERLLHFQLNRHMNKE